MMKVPFVDLFAQYQSVRASIDEAISGVIQHSAYIGGPYVARFEEDFAQWMGVPHCVSCANGTDSLEMILQAAGIGPGDEVVVPAVSWISTAEAVSTVGAVPVFADVDEHFLLDIQSAESKISARTKAVIPVHLYGNPVNMPVLMKWAEKHSLFVLEDCAQSHGAEIHGVKTGTFGHAASFSFYPGKNLGAYGDAGAVITKDGNLAAQVRRISNHGQEGKHNHITTGRNSRLDGLQASILSAKLPHLDQWTSARIGVAARYRRLLGDTSLILPSERPGMKHVYHLFVVQTQRRDELMRFLAERGVSTAIHYPTPLPLLPCYAGKGLHTGEYPGASRTSQILSLPIFAELTDEQIEYTSNAIHQFETQSIS